MEVLPAIWILCGVGAAGIAGSKGRSGFGWLIIGVLLGPIGLLIAAVISPDHTNLARRSEKAAFQDGTLRECPYCAETIQRRAIVCRFCNRDLA